MTHKLDQKHRAGEMATILGAITAAPAAEVVDISGAMTAAKMAAWTYCPATSKLRATPEFYTLLAAPRGAPLGAEAILTRILPEDQQRLRECVRAAAGSADGFFRIDLRIRRFDEQLRWFLLRGNAIVGDAGGIAEVSGMLIDLTERKVEELENAYLAAVVTSTPFAVICVDRTGAVTFWNDGAERSYGFAADEILGRSLLQVVPDDKVAEVRDLMRRVFTGHKLTIETDRVRKSGQRFPAKVTAAPIYAPDGSIVGASAICEDRTEAQASKQRLDLLIRELHHRVRNTLATVQGIAGVTASVSSDIQDFREAFTARVAALAAVHARITEEGSQQIHIDELLEIELGPFMSDMQVSREGPGVRLSSSVAPTLALVIHELATNAVKHGALRGTAGRIEVCWTTDADGRLHFSWREHCPDPAPQTGRIGFGSKLLEIVAPAQFGSKVSRDMAPDGLSVTFSISQDQCAWSADSKQAKPESRSEAQSQRSR